MKQDIDMCQFEERECRIFLVKMALLALFIRFLFSATYYHFFVEALKKPLYALDGEAFSIMGWYISLALKGINMTTLPAVYIPNDYSYIGGLLGTIANFKGMLPPVRLYGVGTYSYLIGIFYYVFGYAPVLLRFMMGFISVMTALIAYFTARRIFSETAGRITYLFCLFMPSFVLYSSSLQRDTAINFLAMLAISQILVLQNMRNVVRAVIGLIVLLVAFWILYLLRPIAIMVLTVFFVLHLFVWFAFSYKRVAFMLIIAAMSVRPLVNMVFDFMKDKIYLMFSYHRGFNYLGGFNFKLLPDQYYTVLEPGKWTDPIGLSTFSILKGCVKGLANFLFEPSLFTVNKFQQLLVIPQMLLWYLVLAYFVLGVFVCARNFNIEKISLIIAAAIFAFTIGISESNYETLLRHRDMIAPIFIMICAYGMTEIGRLKKIIGSR